MEMKSTALPCRVLIVDDEEAARFGMRRALASAGYEVTEAESVEAARVLLFKQRPDLILLDVNLPGVSGVEWLRELSEAPEPSPLIVMITAHGNERLAVDAIKSGAHDYLSKPFEVDELRLVVKNALETITLRRENRNLRRRIELESGGGTLLGVSPSMQRVRSLIEKVAHTDATV